MTSIAMPGLASDSDPRYWRSLGIFNGYRIAIACLLLVSHLFLRKQGWQENFNGALYLQAAMGYLLFSFIAVAFTWFRRPAFRHQVAVQVITDICFIVIIMFAAGGIKSGLGLLLVIAIAAASLLSQGRLALFYAAVATIAILLEQAYQLISWNAQSDDYSHAVMLSVSCFATAWLAYSFGKRTSLSETLASQREVDLENMEQLNELITQEMQDGVLVVDEDFNLRHHNTQAEALLHLQPNAWQGQNLRQCAPELTRLLDAWMSPSADKDSGVVKFSASDKELKLQFMPINQARHQGAVIFIEDWSQMQAQAQQLKLAALGQLTANIAHEIRNPLSAISHATQLLQEEETQDPGSLRMLQIIQDNVQRLDQMVKDILELNRRDRTRQEDIELVGFLNDFHEQFCTTEELSPQRFVLLIEHDSVHILFDQRHLHQILWNLCRNGWRHSQQQEGSLTLALRKTNRARRLQIEVIDDGPGIPAEVQAHLFEPFFTTESTGTGLGLYIARELCEANSATLKYTARKPGSLFTVQVKKAQG